jgi:hypothetical protein
MFLEKILLLSARFSYQQVGKRVRGGDGHRPRRQAFFRQLFLSAAAGRKTATKS